MTFASILAIIGALLVITALLMLLVIVITEKTKFMPIALLLISLAGIFAGTGGIIACISEPTAVVQTEVTTDYTSEMEVK